MRCRNFTTTVAARWHALFWLDNMNPYKTSHRLEAMCILFPFPVARLCWLLRLPEVTCPIFQMVRHVSLMVMLRQGLCCPGYSVPLLLVSWWRKPAYQPQWYRAGSPRIFSFRHLGWGLQSQFTPFCYFSHIPSLSKQTLAIGYHVYIWQVSPQLSCGDTCQIWMWFQESNGYFSKIENFADEEINERSFCNPHPRWLNDWGQNKMWRQHIPMHFRNKMLCVMCWLNFHWGFSTRVQLPSQLSFR